MTTGVRAFVSESRKRYVSLALIMLLVGLVFGVCAKPVSAEDASTTKKYKPTEMNYVDVKNTEYKLKDINGSNVSTLAKGKPKILFFFNTTCPLCKAVEEDLIAAGVNTEKVDFVMAESSMADISKADAKKFYNSCGITSSAKCYASVDVCWKYLRACGYTKDPEERPVKPAIIYISEDNVIKGYTFNYTEIYKWAEGFGMDLKGNPQKPVVTTKTVTYKASALKKSAKTFTLKVSGAKGEKSFKKVSGSKCLKLNSATGKVTVKKGAAKGTYKIKIRVSAAAVDNYNAGTGTVRTVTVKVK